MQLPFRIQVACTLTLILGSGGCSRVTPSREPGTTPSSSEVGEPAVFRDAASQLGLSFAWSTGGRSPLDIRETIGHGCTFLDYDSDGLLDILLVGNDACGLFHNDGDRFTNVTASSGLDVSGPLCGVAVGDYDNDGHPDVYVTGYGQTALYHNRGGASGARFDNVTTAAGVGPRNPFDFVTAAAFVDLDNDGKVDLIAARYINFTPISPRYCRYNNILTTCGVQNYEPAAPAAYLNRGNGTFVDATKRLGLDGMHGRCLGLAIRAADSGSGVEIYAANDEMPCELWSRDGNRFRNLGVTSGTAYGRDGITQGGMGCDWGDFNGDGKQDLVVATFEGEPKSLFKAEQAGADSDVSSETGLSFSTLPYIAWTAKFLDFDNDGWLDIFVTNGHIEENARKVDSSKEYPQPLQLFRNLSGERFQPVGKDAGDLFQTPIVGRGASIGDYDNDGRQDVLIVNEEGRVILAHNVSDRTGHWLGVRLRGKRCNRDAIGARVIVTVGGRSLARDVQLCGGYVSGQDGRLHFGLGSARRTVSIEVRWPDGSRQVIRGHDRRLNGDQYITVEQE